MTEEPLPPAEILQEEAPPALPGPGYRPMLFLSLGVLTAFVGISAYVLWDAKASDETRGAIVQTWNNLAVMVAGFWFGSTMVSKINRMKSGQ